MKSLTLTSLLVAFCCWYSTKLVAQDYYIDGPTELCEAGCHLYTFINNFGITEVDWQIVGDLSLIHI